MIYQAIDPDGLFQSETPHGDASSSRCQSLAAVIGRSAHDGINARLVVQPCRSLLYC